MSDTRLGDVLIHNKREYLPFNPFMKAIVEIFSSLI